MSSDSIAESVCKFNGKKYEKAGPNKMAIKRIVKDIEKFYLEKDENIFIYSNPEDISYLDVLIVGPEDTPYSGGMYHFGLVFPVDYPWSPPCMRLFTTNGGTVRFNPNLYANGKICLSLLGTWSGPKWTSVLNLYTLLLSVRSLMCEYPYYNEPGYSESKESGKYSKVAEDYNKNIVIQNMEVAVIKQMNIDGIDSKFIFHKEMQKIFTRNYDNYMKLCSMNDRLKYLVENLKILKEKVLIHTAGC